MTVPNNTNRKSLIMNSGSVSSVHMTDVDKYNRYGLCYNMGKFNDTFVELEKMCIRMCNDNGLDIKAKDLIKPWVLNEDTNMVKVFAFSRKRPVVMNSEKRVVQCQQLRDGDFAKINVTPNIWEVTKPSFYIDPDGGRHASSLTQKGINMWLNGVLLLDDTELF